MDLELQKEVMGEFDTFVGAETAPTPLITAGSVELQMRRAGRHPCQCGAAGKKAPP